MEKSFGESRKILLINAISYEQTGQVSASSAESLEAIIWWIRVHTFVNVASQKYPSRPSFTNKMKQSMLNEHSRKKPKYNDDNDDSQHLFDAILNFKNERAPSIKLAFKCLKENLSLGRSFEVVQVVNFHGNTDGTFSKCQVFFYKEKRSPQLLLKSGKLWQKWGWKREILQRLLHVLLNPRCRAGTKRHIRPSVWCSVNPHGPPQ